MIDRSQVWTGGVNEVALGTAEPRRVGLYDTTLRDGEQTVGVVLGPEQKLEIARALDRLGVDRIEAGFPRVSPDDRAAFELIANAGLSAEIWGFARALPADVELILELGARATVIEAPVSEGKLAAYGISHEKILDRIRAAVEFAAGAGVTVAFFAVDGSRADLSFLQRVYAAAVEAGAREVVVVDTIGVATPEAAAMLVERTLAAVGDDIPVHWHGHDDFGLATGAAVAAARAGASWVQATINGMGERAGNTDLVEVSMALSALYGYETNLDLRHARETSALVRRLAGYEVEPWKPIVGETLFTRESGAVASQFHDPPAIEPFSATLVGAERRIVLGKKSGIDSIQIRLRELGVERSAEQQQRLLAEVKRLGAAEGRLVSDEEFERLVEATG